MTCLRMPNGIVCVGNPTESVTTRSGRLLNLEWHDYFGPSVIGRRGMLRSLTSREFGDPNVDAWIVSHGGKSCMDDAGPLLPKPRKRRPEPLGPTKTVKPKIAHKAKYIDHKGNVSALCYRKTRAVDLLRETAVMVDASVTCPKCLDILAATPRQS